MADTDNCFWSFEGCPEDDNNTINDGSGDTTDQSGTKHMAGHDGGFDLTIVKDAMVNPVAGNLAFLTVATFITAFSYMRLFRWRKTVDGQDTYYAYWEALNLGTFNYWEWANVIMDWGRLGLFGLAWIFQLIATFGAATGFNRTYWLWGAILGSIALDATYHVMMFIAIEAVRKESEAVSLVLIQEWVLYVATNALYVTVLALGWESWTAGHYRKTGMNTLKVPYLNKTFDF